MVKNSLHDVIPAEKTKRSIRNIPIPERKINKIDELLEETADYRRKYSTQSSSLHMEEGSVPPTKTKKRKTTASKSRSPLSKILLGVAGFLVLGGLVFWLFNESAEVSIALKTETVSINITATTTPDSYQVVATRKEENVELKTTGTPAQVDKKASGTIIIYNNFSSVSQQLIATTRFETPEGLIYRLDSAVTVPGSRTAGGETVPGSIEAQVTADQSGANYNVAKTDFVIPGFKGTTKYEGFYARSKTTMSGGFSGMVGQVSDEDLKNATDNLKLSLVTAITDDISAQIPEDSIFFKNGGIITNFVYNIVPGEAGVAVIEGEMIGEAIVFNRQSISDMVSTQLSEEYKFDNLDSLALSINGGQAITSFISKPSLIITYAGTLTTGQSFNIEQLKTTLAGKSEKQLPEILRMYPEITKAEAITRPFWKKIFPSDTNNIKVIVTK